MQCTQRAGMLVKPRTAVTHTHRLSCKGTQAVLLTPQGPQAGTQLQALQATTCTNLCTVRYSQASISHDTRMLTIAAVS